MPQVFDVQRKGQYVVSMQRLSVNRQTLDFSHSALSLAIAGDLSKDTYAVSPPGDDAFAGVKLVKHLMTCGVEPDLPAAKLLFKVFDGDEARTWMSWMVAQEGGIAFSQSMIKRASRLKPNDDLVAHFKAMMAHAVIRGVARSPSLEAAP